MPDPPDVPAALAHVYWLGGGSGAAKSTVARRLAAAHDLTLYSTDDVMGDHGRRYRPEDCPRLEAFKRMTMDERWVERSPEVMLETFHWFAGEGFGLIVEDLLALPRDRRVIVEGFRPMPALVAPLILSRRQAVWLLPTPAFRRRAFEARGTLWDIPNKTSDPEKALDNLLVRDALFTEQLRREAREQGSATITVDGDRSEDDLAIAVAAHFAL
ncbi:MAG: hypothetical protein AAF333_08085 [Planctomycetota bacterium]